MRKVKEKQKRELLAMNQLIAKEKVKVIERYGVLKGNSNRWWRMKLSGIDILVDYQWKVDTSKVIEQLYI